jgi:imidazolonepropionase-like amidohydrolase
MGITDIQHDVVFTQCRVVDVHTGEVQQGKHIRVCDGIIASIDDGIAPAGTTTIALRGRYVSPGLMNCHTHLQGQYPYALRDPGEQQALTALRAAHHARQALQEGITTVRCVHEQHRADLLVRDASRRDWTGGPRILGAGRALTSPGGHGDGLGCAVARGYHGFLDAAEAELSAGADHVKIFLTGGLARAGEPLETPQMTPEEIRGAVMAARRHDTYVVAHAASGPAIRAALACGVHSFEHAYHIDAGTASLLAEARAFLTPTLVVTHVPDWMRDVGFSDDAIARTQDMREKHFEGIRHAISAGVRLICGTDFPGTARDRGCPLIVRELELLSAAGLSPVEAIRAATANAARLMRIDHIAGQLQPGLAADFVATARDPTQSVSAFRDIQMVVQSGKLIRPLTDPL